MDTYGQTGKPGTELIASERRYRRLFETAKDGILILNVETGMVVDVNPFLVKLLGFSHEAFLGKKVWELGFFKDIFANHEKFLELQKKGYVRYDNLPLETTDGRKIAVEFVSNVYQENGHKVIQCNIRDITKRKLAEEALRENESAKQKLSESLAIAQIVGRVGSWETDIATLKTQWSEQTHRIFETTPDTFNPTHAGFLEFVHPDDRKAVSTALMEPFDSQTPKSIEHRIVMRDGRIKHVEERWQMFDIPENHSSHAIGTCQDITERKLAEEKLRTSEEEFRSLAEAMPQIVWITRPDGWNIYFNQQWMDYTGLTLEESYGHGWNIPFHNDDKQRAWEAWQGATQHNDKYSVECRLRRADGAYRWWLIRGVPLRNANGEILKWFGTCTDIDDIKKTEEDLKEANMRLRKSLEELKLTQEKVIQQERLFALGQMAGGIAHDFNNVLMPILGFSELLLSDPTMLNDRAETIKMLKIINSAGNDARHIVSRLRTIYRKDDNAMYEMVDVAEIAESAISMTMPKWKEEMSAKGANIEMVTDFQPVSKIKGNESELRETLTNLIFNAVDAMPKGGVITFRLYSENKVSVVLEVTDTGIGMNDVTLRRCLEPFFTTKGVQGTGLGLSMVHGIVERHGGSMNIESKTGAGTRICLRFPVPVATGVSMNKPDEKPEQLPPLRILVIDDEESSRDMLRRLLNNDGHYVETAKGGAEGLAVIRQGNFDFVITDRAMPLMSGDEVAREAQLIQPGIPVIMLTGFGDIMKENGECPPGVTRVMTKPVQRNELRGVMGSVMSKVSKQ